MNGQEKEGEGTRKECSKETSNNYRESSKVECDSYRQSNKTINNSINVNDNFNDNVNDSVNIKKALLNGSNFKTTTKHQQPYNHWYTTKHENIEQQKTNCKEQHPPNLQTNDWSSPTNVKGQHPPKNHNNVTWQDSDDHLNTYNSPYGTTKYLRSGDEMSVAMRNSSSFGWWRSEGQCAYRSREGRNAVKGSFFDRWRGMENKNKWRRRYDGGRDFSGGGYSNDYSEGRDYNDYNSNDYKDYNGDSTMGYDVPYNNNTFNRSMQDMHCHVSPNDDNRHVSPNDDNRHVSPNDDNRHVSPNIQPPRNRKSPHNKKAHNKKQQNVQERVTPPRTVPRNKTISPNSKRIDERSAVKDARPYERTVLGTVLDEQRMNEDVSFVFDGERKECDGMVKGAEEQFNECEMEGCAVDVNDGIDDNDSINGIDDCINAKSINNLKSINNAKDISNLNNINNAKDLNSVKDLNSAKSINNLNSINNANPTPTNTNPTINDQEMLSDDDKPYRRERKVTPKQPRSNNHKRSKRALKNARKTRSRIKSVINKDVLLTTVSLECDYTYYFINTSRIHGNGLFASKPIPKGSMIIEYQGIKIGNMMADKLENEYQQNNINSIYLFRLDKDLIIDATVYGNKARFINHSCDPNAEARVTLHDKQRKLLIYALKDILVNQEITMYYNFSAEAGDEELRCNCGSSRCRKVM
ncbi:Histone H3 (Lys4) methyltransferase complex, subunit SET1 [Trachipleistophora hominis]|uniref:[histone H3]-lysine(4) N-trimethyltransferase n=1 Tax=Trachipleistophora hominis TaxID=72359 RepID=L7JU33_TRAHO|nr:Histone H3 (Lys4) methyltransferase complex, subunit SET1 [Trachipleistophora hominis]